MNASIKAAGLGVRMLLVGVAITGCGSNKSSSQPSTTSSPTSTSSASPSSAVPPSSSGASQPSGYGNLLIKPTDIVVPGETFTLASTRQGTDPAGVTGTFESASRDVNGPTREVDVQIQIYGDAPAAAQVRDQTAQNIADPNLGFTLLGGTSTPADVGTGGAMAIGSNSDSSKSRARLMFSEGKAFVQIEFFNTGSAPLQPDFVVDVGRKQDAAIKAGLPA